MKSPYAGTGKHPVAQWEVDDLEEVVQQLTSRGVVFEQYDMPGVEWRGNIASIPSGRAAWFQDSEGNVMCLDERTD